MERREWAGSSLGQWSGLVISLFCTKYSRNTSKRFPFSSNGNGNGSSSPVQSSIVHPRAMQRNIPIIFCSSIFLNSYRKIVKNKLSMILENTQTIIKSLCFFINN